FPYLVVSLDFVKQPSHRDDFIRNCPDFVIVDEAHGSTLADKAGRSRQQRFELVRDITAKPSRHVVLVTATPHSGNEAAFRSLLSLINPKFADLPLEMADDERSSVRRDLARHLVQRRRADIRDFLGANTKFPERLDAEITYTLSAPYKAL